MKQLFEASGCSDLKKLESLKTEDGPCSFSPSATGKIDIKGGRNAGMGPDGSLYFKNVNVKATSISWKRS